MERIEDPLVSKKEKKKQGQEFQTNCNNMSNISTNLSFILVSSLVICFSIIALPEPSEAIARLIQVPLHRISTDSVGSLGQPVVNYIATVNIGTPPVPFKVQFDVALSEHFVPHYSWNPFNRNMHYSNGFQCKLSSTCHKTNIQYTLSYQHVQLTAKRYEDNMSLVLTRHVANTTLNPNVIQMQPIEVTSVPPPPVATGSNTPSWRQNFLAVSSASDARFSPLPIDGFLGLSPAFQSPSGVDNLLVSLHKANLIDNLQFSMWFNPILDDPNGGELTLGGVDTNRYQGQIYWHQLSSVANNQWTLNLQQVSLGYEVIGCSGDGQPCQAVLSSGISDILGPRDQVKKIYTALNTVTSSTGLELVDCRRIRSMPNLIFNIDGVPYYLYPSNYVRKTVEGKVFKKETCYVAILPSNDEGKRVWTLGPPFLGAYYSVYDLTNRQLGFAMIK